MPLISALIKNAIEFNSKLPKIKRQNPIKAQQKVLKKLLKKASKTAFGEYYDFEKILNTQDFEKSFRENIPIFDYNKIHNEWWYRSLLGETDVTWPGKVKYFALSSGTSEASSKYIPITNDMLRAIKKTSVRTLLALANFDIPKDFFSHKILMLGGSTHLQYNGTYYAGDLSGITTGNIPFWFQFYYKPGKKISRERDWEKKLEEIVNNAPKWDIGAIVGVPSWFQILFLKIIEKYQLNHIHEIWPNLTIFTHGGVSFIPYKKSFEKLLGKPLIYLETYLASEGYIAFQNKPNVDSMALVYDNGIYYEFIPFNDKNFDSDGNLVDNPETITLKDVQPNTEYAILLSTVAGAWRYLIGDVIKFTSVLPYELQIVGRTKHYLSVCGEHLSVENMTRAIELLEHDYKVSVPEFTVAALPYQGMFMHKWWLGTNQHIDPVVAANAIDNYLKNLNDDYRTERLEAIRKVEVEVLPLQLFYDYLKSIGKIGAQIKFPRVMKKNLEDWIAFVEKNKNR
ncbi:MAG: GH3 auxin-responsive promoter family protein [Bacteroidales bacterium]|nr:GH3 auxin-responsive promoter family protein [Bacteroidales bacterium]